MSIERGCDQRLGDDPVASGEDFGGGRLLAGLAVAGTACGLALVPAAIGLRLVHIDPGTVGWPVGGVVFALGVTKVAVMAWAVVERWRPGHPVRLANVLAD